MLKIRNLESGYENLKVLRKISMHVSPGEIVTIIGANGAGKSTLLKTISGQLPARSGEILFRGDEIGSMNPEKIVFRGCSLVPEGRQVFATMTVRENLILGGFVLYRGKGMAAVEREMEKVYGLFPILQERAGQLAGTLSGGEQQMLAIGRALMSRPALVMMDEPSMGLAPLIVKGIMRAILKLRDEGNTVLLVEQNARAALKVADRGYVIETGKLVLEGRSDFLLGDKEIQRAYLGKGYTEIWE
jgi:branched-chain amino acid transport system ATP-binding protein